MYQPKLARFMSRDPLSENGQELMTDTGFVHSRLNAMREHPYVYARNNPVLNTDQTGLLAQVQNQAPRQKTGKTLTKVSLCVRPLRNIADAFAHVYLTMDKGGGPAKGDVISWSAGPDEVYEGCEMKCKDRQLRVYFFTFVKKAPDYPKDENERSKHICNHYVFSPRGEGRKRKPFPPTPRTRQKQSAQLDRHYRAV